MSTKIYNAYIYVGRRKGALGLPFALAAEIRAALLPFAHASFHKKAGMELARLIDRCVLGKSHCANGDESESAMFRLTEEHDRARKEIERGVREPSWDFSAEWSFFLVGEKLLLRFFGENQMVEEFERVFCRQFRDYHFQDSTDRPSSVSAREWGQRKRDWCLAMGSKSAAETGITCSLFGKYSGPSLYELDEIVAATPSLERRVLALANDLTLDSWARSQLAGIPNPASHQVVRVLMNWPDAKAAPAIQARIAAHERILRRYLLPSITRADALKKGHALRQEARSRAAA